MHTTDTVGAVQRVLVCGWVGSTNLGDELVLAGVRAALAQALTPPVRVAAASIAADQTRSTHQCASIDHRRLDLLERAARTADLVVLGGGGLIQDETSPFNLPYHLSRVRLAKLVGTPWVGFGLGVGRLDTPLGRRLTTTLRSARAVSVRDEASQALLADLGVPAVLGADAVWHLAPSTTTGSPYSSAFTGPATPAAPPHRNGPRDHPRPEVEGEVPPDPVIVASLRPWSGPGGRLPVAWRGSRPDDAAFVPAVAAALERASRASGLPVRFVALQTDRDALLHEQIAARMSTPTELVVPTLDTVLHEVGRGRVVVAMRYHAGIAATLAGRPSVLVGYSPKVDALAATLGTGAAHLPFDTDVLRRLDEAILTQLDATDAATAVARARETFIARTAVNLEVLRSGVS